jgi:Tfp pilus assembly protein FimT
MHRSSGPMHRRGATLLELTLALALMAIVLAMAWPMLERPLAHERLRKSADIVLAEWTSARVDAMRFGVHRIFRFQPQTKSYEIAGEAESETRELPEGIVFATSVKSADAREELESGGSQHASEPEIWFYPDGTTSDVQELLLRNDHGMQIRLTLRGLTGIGTIDTDVPDAMAAPEARR